MILEKNLMEKIIFILSEIEKKSESPLKRIFQNKHFLIFFLIFIHYFRTRKG